METSFKNALLTLCLEDSVVKLLQEFNLHNHTKNLSQGTIRFYDEALRSFTAFLNSQGVYLVRDITPTIIRQYLLQLSTHRNAGGVHAHFRAIRAWLNFYIQENDVTNWSNPCDKARPKKPNIAPIQGVTVEQLEAMLKVCKSKRDVAILRFLFSSGVRRAELCALNLADVTADGAVCVRRGKAGKWRICFIDKPTMKALRQYLRQRENLTETSPLFATHKGERLTVNSLSSLIQRIASRAGLSKIGCHSFRRGFGAYFVAHGGNVAVLKELLGHSDITTTQRYYSLQQHELHSGYQKGWQGG